MRHLFSALILACGLIAASLPASTRAQPVLGYGRPPPRHFHHWHHPPRYRRPPPPRYHGRELHP